VIPVPHVSVDCTVQWTAPSIRPRIKMGFLILLPPLLHPISLSPNPSCTLAAAAAADSSPDRSRLRPPNSVSSEDAARTGESRYREPCGPSWSTPQVNPSECRWRQIESTDSDRLPLASAFGLDRVRFDLVRRSC
jgi:hypothetical protein